MPGGEQGGDAVGAQLQLPRDPFEGQRGVVVADDPQVGRRLQARREPRVGAPDRGQRLSCSPEAGALPGLVQVAADDDPIVVCLQAIEEAGEPFRGVPEAIGAIPDAEVKVADDGDAHEAPRGWWFSPTSVFV